MHGLLSSQSCYHCMLVPCWFTLWTSGRFLQPYILLISLEIFLIFLFVSFFLFQWVSNFWYSSRSLFPPFLQEFWFHACWLLQAYEPRPLLLGKFCTAVILSGKQQNGDPTRACSLSCSTKTSDSNMSSPDGDTLFVWLVTCVLRNHNMASNT